jgi:hypothetical protein
MSKKSRRRNRNLLKMAALAGGAALLAGRGRGVGTQETISDAQKVGSQLGAASDVTGTVYPGANKAVAAATPISKGVRRTRHRLTDSAGNTIPSTNKMANIAAMNAPKNVMGPFDYMQPTPVRRGLNFRSNRFAKGGRVKLAKRGLGRAFTKRKK